LAVELAATQCGSDPDHDALDSCTETALGTNPDDRSPALRTSCTSRGFGICSAPVAHAT
jgi:hypothetical protein